MNKYLPLIGIAALAGAYTGFHNEVNELVKQYPTYSIGAGFALAITAASTLLHKRSSSATGLSLEERIYEKTTTDKKD